MSDLFYRAGAVISECGKYRYRLSRTWDEALPAVVFVMLNPSTADHAIDDPTVRRCVGFARAWGYGSIVIVNLFALRAANPNVLHDDDDPVGPANDEHIRQAVMGHRRVIAAWGVMGTYKDREAQVMRLLREAGATVQCLGVTKYGRPKHPLYVAGDTDLVPFGENHTKGE